jgi:hypothetical protein
MTNQIVFPGKVGPERPALTRLTQTSTLEVLRGIAANQASWLLSVFEGFGAAADGHGLVKSGSNPVWQEGGSGGLSDAPSDGNTYARLNAAWSSITTALTNAREWTADIVSQAEAEAGTATTRGRGRRSGWGRRLRRW